MPGSNSPPDPLAPVIQALSYLAAPNPAVNNPPGGSPPQTPSTWTGSTQATPGPFYTPAQLLLGVILGAAADLTTLGNGINSALTDVGAALANFASQIGTLESGSDPSTVLSDLQTVLNLVLSQGLVPPSEAGTLQSLSTLFGLLNTLLSQVTLETNDMAAISQQLALIALLFPAA